MAGYKPRRNTDPDHMEEVAKAVALRRGGATFKDIGDQLDISEATAFRWVSNALARIPAEDVAMLRRAEGERLDRLQRAVWGQALKGDIRSVETALRIVDRRIKLYGLDAPQQVEIGVGAVDIAGTARNILAQVNGDVDAEIIDEQDD